MPALLQNWSREAQAFVALRDAWAAGVEPQFPWAWRFERVPPTHPLAACVDGYLVWERHFRAPIAAAAEAMAARLWRSRLALGLAATAATAAVLGLSLIHI